jgi:hypothetical protein
MEFDTKYVHYMWDVKLDGLEAFYAYDIESLKYCVESDDKENFGKIHFSFDESAPFAIENESPDMHFKFVYCDPHYKFKWAHEHGERIEALASYGDGVWFEIENPTWDLDPSKYRIKKEKPAENDVTNRELAKWLVLGNGEYCVFCGEVSTVWTYHKGEENEFVDSKAVHIRKWDSEEWLPLTKENLLVSYGM